MSDISRVLVNISRYTADVSTDYLSTVGIYRQSIAVASVVWGGNISVNHRSSIGNISVVYWSALLQGIKKAKEKQALNDNSLIGIKTAAIALVILLTRINCRGEESVP